MPSSSSSIHLAVPTNLRQFHRFANFPFDIRHQIWENIIFTPGIHFLKFVINSEILENGSDSPADDSDGTADGSSTLPTEGKGAKRPKFTGTLQPVYPFAAADKSYYLTMNKTFTQLSLTCNEARQLVEKLISRPANLTLDNGRLVLLERSSDIVCIGYPVLLRSSGLGRWADNLDLEQLGKIRRLAVRYCSNWDNQSQVCNTCGRVHIFRRDPRPRHVFEFAALFKNLETFYFMDCLAIPYEYKGERFASGEGGRTYYEADPQYCKVTTHVFKTLEWVRDNYIQHCQKNSKGPADPDKVKFKVLTCEWDSEELSPVKRQELRADRPLKQQKARAAALADGMKKLSLAGASNPNPKISSGLPVVFGDDGQYKFEFSMEIPRSASRS
ncbi:hypothetical protein AAE478_005227 [Parahypoxylon ruwenzoriense]